MGKTSSHALITGASSGIGLEIARELARRGHDLILTARRRDRLEQLSSELGTAFGVNVQFITSDLADPEAPAALVRAIADRGLQIGVLVNNSGFGLSAPFAEADPKALVDMVQVNVAALTHLTRLVLPDMIARHSGRILNVASTAAYVPGPLMAVYYASKAYVESFSVAIAHEVRHTGVSVTLLCPGPTKTEFSSVARGDKTKLFRHSKSMSAAVVARAGVDGLLRGQTTVIPGLANRLVPIVERILPRSVMASIAGRMNRTI